MAGATHFSLSLSANRVWPGEVRPFLRPPTPPPYPQGTRHAPHSPATQRRGGGGRGQVALGPTLAAEGACTAAAGLKSDGRRSSCAFWSEAGARSPRSARAGGAAPPLRLAGMTGCQIQRGGGGGSTGVPPRPLPTRLKGGRETRKPGFFRPPPPTLSNHFPRL